MNIAESNHISTDLGIPYMDTNENYLQPKTRKSKASNVIPNENFGLIVHDQSR